jgi:putative aldouronate transport system permease protein
VNRKPKPGPTAGRGRKALRYLARNYQLYILLALVMAYFVIFKYLPMYGLQMAFQDFNPIRGFRGSKWVGFDQFIKMFKGFYFMDSLRNTLVLSFYSLIAGFPFPIIFALLLNTLNQRHFKKFIQTVAYAPNFISTVVIVGMLKIFMSPSTGFINKIIEALGGRALNFFGSAAIFPHLYVWSGVWQSMGWGAVIYFAALAGISPELHEAAIVDGASRLRRIWHIDLPGIIPTAVILLIMSMAGVVNVGFEKVFLMQTPLNIATSEVISTYSYKVGIEQIQYSYSAAVGMFNSVVTFVLLMIINRTAKKLTDISLW